MHILKIGSVSETNDLNYLWRKNTNTEKNKENKTKKIQEYSTLALFTEELLLDSQCTVRAAENEVTVAKLLLATHLYCPAFDC